MRTVTIQINDLLARRRAQPNAALATTAITAARTLKQNIGEIKRATGQNQLDTFVEHSDQ